jgi:hypothetical protein
MTCYSQEHAEFVAVLTASLNDSQANKKIKKYKFKILHTTDLSYGITEE